MRCAMTFAAILMLVLPAAHAAAQTCTAPAFGSPRPVPLPAIFTPYGAAGGDFDADGHDDIAAVYQRNFTSDAQDLFVLRGDGAGGFTTTTTALPPTLFLLNLRPGDVTGDGDIDLVATAYGPDVQDSAVVVLEGDGEGGFALRSPIPLDGFALDHTLGDVDGDGNLDVVAVTEPNDGSGNPGSVWTLLNDGTGGFGVPLMGPAGLYPNGVTTADFNGDGHTDVAIANFELGEPTAPGRVEIRLGNGSGTFGLPVSFRIVSQPYRIQTGDFNEDGHPDLAVATAPSNQPGTITVLLGDGTGGMSAPSAFASIAGLYEVVVADFTGDGHPDLAGSGAYYVPAQQVWLSALAVFPGTGAGTFGAPTLIQPPSNGTAFLPIAGDFDEDGRLDLAGAGSGPSAGARIVLFLSMCGNVADLAVSMTDSPDPVVLGRQITYTVSVVNNGPDPASASLGFRIPSGMGLVSATASTGACAPAAGPPTPSDRTIRCVLGDLAGSSPGNMSTVTVVVQAGTGGPAEALAAVTTSVHDPVAGNNTDSEATLVTVPGATNTTISAPGSTTSLTWNDGDAEAGYVVWRVANGVATRFPAAGMLPATSTGFVDSSPVPGTLNCYRVVASAADESPMAASEWLCQSPNSAAPPDALSDFRLWFSNDRVRLQWSPFTGHTHYLLRTYSASGTRQSTVSGETTSLLRDIQEFTCFVLIAMNSSTVLANSPALCMVPPP